MLRKRLILVFSVIALGIISLENIEGAEVESFSVPAGGVQTFWFNLEPGDSVSGSMSIAGGGNDINFWVTDPSGNVVIPKQGVTGGKDFTFTAERSGAHTAYFDNSFSFIQSKAVTLTYDVDFALGGGCLIATATFGSELAPQVQQLRELRDNTLLQTESGSAFMSGFNDLYYSFSPTIADWERQNPVFKEAVKIGITPLLTSLSILNYVDMDSDTEVLGYGISLILLNIGMYVVAPVGIGMFVASRKSKNS